MSRQASMLRDRIGIPRRRRVGPSSVLAVASGRGGAGVSLVAAALALRSAALGRRTLLVDADPWLDLQRIWLGAPAGVPLASLRGGRDPESLVVDVGDYLELLSFGSGGPSDPDVRALARRVPTVFGARDTVVVDAGSGLTALERALDLNAGSMVCVSGADPVGLATTHAMIKACASTSPLMPVVLFNHVQEEQATAGRAVLSEGGRNYLGFEPRVAGVLSTDADLHRALAGGGLLPAALAGSKLVAKVDSILPTLTPWRSARHVG